MFNELSVDQIRNRLACKFAEGQVLKKLKADLVGGKTQAFVVDGNFNILIGGVHNDVKKEVTKNNEFVFYTGRFYLQDGRVYAHHTCEPSHVLRLDKLEAIEMQKEIMLKIQNFLKFENIT